MIYRMDHSIYKLYQLEIFETFFYTSKFMFQNDLSRFDFLIMSINLFDKVFRIK